MSKTILEYFLDTNIFIRLIATDGTNKHLEFSKKVFKAIKDEKIVGITTTIVINEILYVMTGPYDFSRTEVVESLFELLSLKNLKVIDMPKISIYGALNDFKRYSKIDFTDCIIKQVITVNGYNLLSFDKHFDKLGVPRDEDL